MSRSTRRVFSWVRTVPDDRQREVVLAGLDASLPVVNVTRSGSRPFFLGPWESPSCHVCLIASFASVPVRVDRAVNITGVGSPSSTPPPHNTGLDVNAEAAHENEIQDSLCLVVTV